MKKLIIAISLVLTSCATCPKVEPTVVETPIAIRASHIDVPSCPELPIVGLSIDSNWDIRIKAWEATIVILKGCEANERAILEDLNK